MRNVLTGILLFIASAASAQVVLNEICPANADVIYDPDFYNFSPWVELYNAGNASVNVGNFYLSDDESEPLKWRIPGGVSIPPKGFLLFWCDDMNAGRHANFSLDSEGEDVVLSNNAGVLLDKISYPKQYTNISFGRTVNGTGSWGYLSVPTPAAGNHAATATEQLIKPDFSVKGGRYASGIQLTLTHSTPHAEIRYTTDGSEPTAGSPKFSTAVNIAQTSTVKAKAFLNGFLPGKTETQTYFINEHTFSLPVISISTRPAYLYDNTIGIYIEGTNGVDGYCNGNPVNWNQDWDRHAVLEYYDKDGNRLFNQAVDIRIGGNCSRNQPQKSFAIKARDKYGSNIMNYKFFDNKNVNQFGALMLRNSGNDFNVTMFRDAFMQSLPVGQMDVDYMDYQPAILYLNGEYMGIQNIREKIDADFIESNYSVDKDDLDLIETYENALEGTSDAYVNYKNTLAGMNRTTPEAFAYIDQHIDVQEYINYLVAQIYFANTDWPGNNMKFWRDASVNGKFRWILWDTDFGFALYEGASWATHPTLNFATAIDGPGWPNPEWSTLHIRMVLENPIFRARFIQTMNTALNTTFDPDRVISIINQFQTRIAQEMPYHKTRWWGNMNDWNYEVQRLRDFAVARNAYMRQHMAEFFGLNGTVNISTEVKQGEGKISLNQVTAEAKATQPYFTNLPVTVEPVPELGYVFKEWKIKKTQSTGIALIQSGAVWKFFDQGTMPVNWNTSAFNDASWAEGPAQLGYGEGDEATVVSFGPNASNKYVTTYFRKSFSIADTVGLTPLNGSLLVDDGAVIYFNGLEVGRINMPGGAISFSTFALDGTIEGAYTAFTIPKGLIKPGTNVLGVEIHQNNAGSSDLSFDLSLNTVRLGTETTETSTVPVQMDTAYTNISYEAYFEASGTIINDIIINEISTSPSALLDNAGEAEDWIELYNAGTQAVNLVGLYLTDNLNNRTRHKLLAGTGDEMILQPGAYKILWADEDLNQGADHLSFKLSANGEAVGLYQKMGENIHMINEYVFGEQLFPGSFSRIPNGSGPFVFTVISTPDSFNEIITGIDEEITVRVYPNPVSDYIYVDSPTILQNVELMDCLGRSIQSFSNIRQQQIPMHNNAPGIYILRLKSGNRFKTLKIIKE
jgi:CotH kinase protein/Chitobiase/beta-hexosaminidase C-terminal domain/Lamin Tail Domain/Secretion system C-terminal sorting domain